MRRQDAADEPDAGEAAASTDEMTGGFEMFRRRALAERGQTDHLWRVGFDPSYRQGTEAEVARALMMTFQAAEGGGSKASELIDIGSGASPLTDSITEECARLGLTHVVVDSTEMLGHLADDPNRLQVPGRFPTNSPELLAAVPKARFVLAYSVLQYVMRDMSAHEFVMEVCALLDTGGVALIGDLPNRDLRDRQMRAAGVPRPAPASVAEIRDELLLDLVRDVRSSGLHAYLLPQSPAESMRLHRENLMIVRPGAYSDKGPSERTRR